MNPTPTEEEQFHESAAKAIYLQGVLLALLGIAPDTARPSHDITTRVRALLANEKGGCPHVVAGAEGTSYCALAESVVLALRKQLREARPAALTAEQEDAVAELRRKVQRTTFAVFGVANEVSLTVEDARHVLALIDERGAP